MERTREQIVAATVEAHRELGIQATSFDEIARRAGVGVGTVYRHFRSLDELLPACGQTVVETMALPTTDEIPGAFECARSARARIEVLVRLVFGVYERAAPFVHNIRHERDQLPQLEPWHRMIEDTLHALLAEALRQLTLGPEQWETVRALLDLGTWQAFRQRELSDEEIHATVAQLIYSAVRPPRRADQAGTAAGGS